MTTWHRHRPAKPRVFMIYEGLTPKSAQCAACAVGRIYDPSGKNDRAPLDEIGLETWGANAIEYRQGG
jgi:hypothetical protein